MDFHCVSSGLVIPVITNTVYDYCGGDFPMEFLAGGNPTPYRLHYVSVKY